MHPGDSEVNLQQGFAPKRASGVDYFRQHVQLDNEFDFVSTAVVQQSSRGQHQNADLFASCAVIQIVAMRQDNIVRKLWRKRGNTRRNTALRRLFFNFRHQAHQPFTYIRHLLIQRHHSVSKHVVKRSC